MAFIAFNYGIRYGLLTGGSLLGQPITIGKGQNAQPDSFLLEVPEFEEPTPGEGVPGDESGPRGPGDPWFPGGDGGGPDSGGGKDPDGEPKSGGKKGPFLDWPYEPAEEPRGHDLPDSGRPRSNSSSSSGGVVTEDTKKAHERDDKIKELLDQLDFLPCQGVGGIEEDVCCTEEQKRKIAAALHDLLERVKSRGANPGLARCLWRQAIDFATIGCRSGVAPPMSDSEVTSWEGNEEFHEYYKKGDETGLIMLDSDKSYIGMDLARFLLYMCVSRDESESVDPISIFLDTYIMQGIPLPSWLWCFALELAFETSRNEYIRNNPTSPVALPTSIEDYFFSPNNYGPVTINSLFYSIDPRTGRVWRRGEEGGEVVATYSTSWIYDCQDPSLDDRKMQESMRQRTASLRKTGLKFINPNASLFGKVGG